MRASSSLIRSCSGPMPSIGLDRALQHVVAAAELAGLLDGDDVAGLLDDAHDVRVAAVVAQQIVAQLGLRRR